MVCREEPARPSETRRRRSCRRARDQACAPQGARTPLGVIGGRGTESSCSLPGAFSSAYVGVRPGAVLSERYRSEALRGLHILRVSGASLEHGPPRPERGRCSVFAAPRFAARRPTLGFPPRSTGSGRNLQHRQCPPRENTWESLRWRVVRIRTLSTLWFRATIRLTAARAGCGSLATDIPRPNHHPLCRTIGEVLKVWSTPALLV